MTEVLLQRLKRGDPDALERIVKHYTPYVCAVIANQLGDANRDDIEELASDVFFSLWTWRTRLKTEHLRGWLGATARNKARDLLRKKQLELLPAEDWLVISDPDAERLLDEKEQNAVLTQALAELEDQTREIFLRYYFYNQKTAVIAEELKMNQSTIKNRLARGRGKLRDILTERGYTIED